VVDLHDVGVLQVGDGLCLGPEASDGLGVGIVPGEDHLQNAVAVQKNIPGAIDDAHAATPQLAQDLIAIDGREG
jgi:hypothetical protein